MKLKGIWVAIAVICVAGIGITDYSARHLAGSETQYVSGEDAQQGVSGLADTVPVETEAGNGSRHAFSMQNSAAEPDEESFPENRGLWPRLICRMSRKIRPAELSWKKKKGSRVQRPVSWHSSPSWMTRRKSAGMCPRDSSANALKAAAESERKIWESKMQSILEILEQQLSGDEKTAFFTEQRSWVRDRESAAVANSKKQSGSALEELEYIRSLRDLTRERVYDLAGRYETVLDKTE